MAWAPYALAAVSALSQNAANRGVEKKQQQLAEAMRQYGLVKSGEQQAATQKYIDTITPEARAAQLQGAQGDVRQSLDQTVADAVKAQPLQDFGGRVSQDYTRQRASGVADTSEKIRRAIEQLSVAGATGKVATADQTRARLTGGQVQDAATAFNNVGSQYQNAMQTVRPNTGLTTLAQLAGAGSSVAFGMPGNSLIGLRL